MATWTARDLPVPGSKLFYINQVYINQEQTALTGLPTVAQLLTRGS